MIADAFVNELARTGPSEPLEKLARGLSPDTVRLIQRMATGGALGTTSFHGARHAKAALTGDSKPRESTAKAALRGATGGTLAAALLTALGKMGRR